MEKKRFLDKKYADLAGSLPVERAAQKEKREEVRTPYERVERIDAYLNRLQEIIENPSGFKKEEGDRGGFDLLKHKILEKYVTKIEDVPESYWTLQREIARNRGEGGDWDSASEEQLAELKQRQAEEILRDQRASLEEWIDYLGSSDSSYIPKELKYWIFRSVLGMQEMVKKKEGDHEFIEFPKRSKGTMKPFPDINYESLGYVVDAVVKKLEGKGIEFEHDIQPDEREAFKELLAKEDFAKLYAWASELMNPIPEHLLPVTEGAWVKYAQDSDPKELIKTIRGKGTGWCTAGLNTAKTQLQGGDFYVYYSLDDEGASTIPRLAIRMEGHEKIAEDPRGIAYKQNVDPYMTSVLDEKLKEFGAVGEAYKKKSADMKHLTEIDGKTKKKEQLTKADLTFLYELDSKIEGFGYQKDPRIAALRDARDTSIDLPILFNCTPQDIAHTVSEISQTTKAYIGPLEPGIFDALPSTVEHVYTKFPESRVKFRSVELGTGIKDGSAFQKAIEENDMRVGDWATDLLKRPDFKVVGERVDADLVEVSVAGLGFTASTRYDAICARAQGLGLELCPAEVGPQLRLQYTDQPNDEYLQIAMKAINDSDGDPRVFKVDRDDVELWLYASYGGPDYEWSPEGRFVFFRPRK